MEEAEQLKTEPQTVPAEEIGPREILRRLFDKEIEVDFSIQSLRTDLLRELDRVPGDKQTKRHEQIRGDIKAAQDRANRRIGLIQKTAEDADKWGRKQLSDASAEWSRAHHEIDKKDVLLHAEVSKMALQKEEGLRRVVKRAIQDLQDKLQKDLELIQEEVLSARAKINTASKPIFDQVHKDLENRKLATTNYVGVFVAGLRDLRLEQIEELRDKGSVEYVVGEQTFTMSLPGRLKNKKVG